MTARSAFFLEVLQQLKGIPTLTSGGRVSQLDASLVVAMLWVDCIDSDLIVHGDCPRSSRVDIRLSPIAGGFSPPLQPQCRPFCLAAASCRLSGAGELSVLGSEIRSSRVKSFLSY